MKKAKTYVTIMSLLLFCSCQKEEHSVELSEATVSGNIWANLDETDDIDFQGLYIESLNKEGVAGMQVSAIVNTAYWVQNPVAGYVYDKEVYTTITDDFGNYSLTVPATAEGYNITLQFGDIITTKKKFVIDTQNEIVEEVIVSLPDKSVFIYGGATIKNIDEATAVPTAILHEYGSATVTGTVYAFYNDFNFTENIYDYPLNTGSGITNQEIHMKYDLAPYGNGYENIFSFEIDGDGVYTMVFPTEIATASPVNIHFGCNDFIANYIIPNWNYTADSTISARYYLDNKIEEYFLGGVESGSVTVMDVFLDVDPIY
jgi:hypothetical protein